MTTAPLTIDPITLEILHNGLRSITDECFIALMKSAYSTNIKERRDHSATIMDRNGQLIVQAEHSLPIHIGSMLGLMHAVLKKYGREGVRPGDIFVANDPYVAGGSHLPDVNLGMPVFVAGELVAFICNIAHHADIGGMAPGSMAGGMTEIFQEGLRIPPVKLFREGELQQDILDLLLLNVRVPEERRGDYFAQIAACKLGERRLKELIATHSAPVITTAFEEIVTRTESRMRAAVATIPDGVYRFEDVMDDDGLGAKDILIKVAVEVKGDRINFDFRGSAPQVQGNINVTTSATQAAVCYTLKALLDPQVPNNEGILRVAQFTTEPGTLLDASFPAACAARAHTCQRIIDVIIGALAPALPDKVVGAANGANTTAVFFGRDPRTGRDFLYLETMGGGFGGRATKDGKDGVQVHITNTSNLPVEAIEMEYPLLVDSYGLIPDTGGAGKNRGGLALRRVVKPVGLDCQFNGAGERFRNQPWGVFGGKPGATGRFFIQSDNGDVTKLSNKPDTTRLRTDQSLVVETPGAGGYGPPAERSRAALEEDFRSGKFSAEFLRTHYGFEPGRLAGGSGEGE
ncbi:MAG: hydantoinase B/oxoprolinase family protein [Alphaproteobacteria bacterium]|nr:hydantoinase B/oxoprolinase family protein [Alphaproteobacteria bacterium]